MTASSYYPLFFIPLTLFPENPARSARGFWNLESLISSGEGLLRTLQCLKSSETES